MIDLKRAETTSALRGRVAVAVMTALAVPVGCDGLGRDKGVTSAPKEAAVVRGGTAEAKSNLGGASWGPRDSKLASVFPAGVAKDFQREAGGLRARFDGAGTPAVRTLLPEQANQPFRVEDVRSGLAVDVTLQEARGVKGEVEAGYLVYPRAHVSGATVLNRVSPEGLEDYLRFDEAPKISGVEYSVKLGKGVGGLRLVEGTLEMLDTAGTPRLRVLPPFVVGADGARTDAKLAVAGCAYDTNPAGPWGRPVTAPGAKTCSVSVAWNGAGIRYPAVLDPQWATTTGTAMTPARGEHTALLLSTGKVLVAGGRTLAGTASINTCQLYDPATQSWSMTGSMATARRLHTMVQLGATGNTNTANKVWVAGGLNGTSSTTSTELYIVSGTNAGTWGPSAGPALTTARHDHTATVLANGTVLLTGGTNTSTALNTAVIYNPAGTGTSTGSWTTVSSTMSSNRRGHTATLLVVPGNTTLNNKVLIVGGNNGGTSNPTVNTYQIFDATAATPTFGSASTITAGSVTLVPEGHQATALSNGDVMVTGGKTLTGSSSSPTTTFLNNAFRFNVQTGSGVWASAGTMNVRRWGHTATLQPSTIATNGIVVVVGGTNTTTGTSLGSAEVWNGSTTTPTWRNTTALLSSAVTQKHTATLVGNTVLIAGGLNSSNAGQTLSQLFDSRFCSATSDCVDSNLCHVAPTCSSGVCTTGSTVTCTSDTCMTRTCNGTSACTLTPRNLNVACDDAMACTFGEKCNSAGSCTGGTTVTCTSDQCNTRTCNGTSTCTVAAKTGMACDDGMACTFGETCSSGGSCTGGTSITCTSDQCNTKTCNGTSMCVSVPKTGVTCNDGMACTYGETCNSSGQCTGGTSITCTSDQCNTKTCNGTSMCASVPKTGVACTDGMACTYGETCNSSGQCTGGTSITCTSDQCNTKTCNGTSACTVVAKTGVACTDSNACTQNDTCDSSGACIPGPSLSCPGATACATACTPATGCTPPVETNEGGSCEDGNPNTSLGMCLKGICRGSNPSTPSSPIYGELLDLGAVRGDDHLGATVVDNEGNTAGMRDQGDIWYRTSTGRPASVVFQGGTGHGYGQVAGINSSGVIAGEASLTTDGSGETLGFTAASGAAAVMRPSNPVDGSVRFTGINDLSSLSGTRYLSGDTYRGVRVTGGVNGTSTVLTMPGPFQYNPTEALAIGPGANGEVVGRVQTFESPVFPDGYVFTSGWGMRRAIRSNPAVPNEWQVIPVSDTAASHWRFLNAAHATNGRQITGWGVTTNNRCRAFRYTPQIDELIDLGPLEGPQETADACQLGGMYTFLQPHAINAAGDIVGMPYYGGAFYFNDTLREMIDLQTLVDPASKATLNAANSINDHGEIVGAMYVQGDSRPHAYKMTLPEALRNPVPGLGNVEPRVDGYVDLGPNAGARRYVVVFGYKNVGADMSIPVADGRNQLLRNGEGDPDPNPVPSIPTQFTNGTHVGAFLPRAEIGDLVAWTLGTKTSYLTVLPSSAPPLVTHTIGTNGIGIYIDDWEVEIRPDQPQALTLKFEGIADFSTTDRVAIFSYTNNTDKNIHFPAGAATNALFRNGSIQPMAESVSLVPQWFELGSHPGAVAVPWTTGTTSITWKVDADSATATDTGTHLAVGPSADGDGSGPILPGGTVNIRPTYANTIATSVVATDWSYDSSHNPVAAGEVPGTLSVSDDGAAEYAVPLALPPGRNGMTPSLALQYNSRRGNGPFGIGWDLSGISRIAGCKRTVIQDGTAKQVQFDANDALCLDGRRLVPVTPSTSGTLEFRTEVESYAKIVATVDEVGRPGSFDVWELNGTIHHYFRNYATKKVAPVNPNSDVNNIQNIYDSGPGLGYYPTWERETTKDRYGNTIRYTYNQAGGTAETKWGLETLVKSIVYTEATDHPGRMSVVFNYEDRADKSSGYISGVRFNRSKLCTSIDTKVDGTIVRSYRLDYAHTGSISERSLMTQIRECDGSGICKRPTKFTWTPGVEAFGDSDATPPGGPNAIRTDFRAVLASGDFNGDGADDIIYRVVAAPGADLPMNIRFGSTSGAFSSPIVVPNMPTRSLFPETATWMINPLHVADLNRDGRSDVVILENGGYSGNTFYPGRWRFYLSKGDGLFDEVPIPHPELSGAGSPLFFGDMDGDGVAEIFEASQNVIRGPEGGQYYTNYWQYRKTDNTALLNGPYDWLDRQDPNRARMGYLGWDSGWIPINVVDTTGAGYFHVLAPEWIAGDYPHSPDPRVEMPAGPLKDMSWYGRQVDIHDYPATTIPSRIDKYPAITYFADVNGDGLADAVPVLSDQDATTEQSARINPPNIMTNSGNGFMAANRLVVTTNWPALGEIAQPAGGGSTHVFDWNQDGRQDLLLLDDGEGTRQNAVVLMSANAETGQPSQVGYDTTFVPVLTSVPVGKVNADEGGGMKYRLLHTMLDANGDGLADILQLENDGHLHLRMRQGGKADQLVTVTTGMGATESIQYKAMNAASGIYSPGSMSECASGPTCVMNGPSAVSKVTHNQGRVGARTDQYTYVDARTDGSGRGWLGVRKRVMTQVETGAVITTTYGNREKVGAHYPQVHSVIDETTDVPTVANGSVAQIVQTTTTNEIADVGGGRVAVRPSRIETFERERNNGAVSVVRHQIEDRWYHTSGSLWKREVHTDPDHVHVELITDETEDLPNWIRHRPHRIESSDTSLSGGGTLITVRQIDHELAGVGGRPPTGVVTDETTEPDDASNPLSEVYRRVHYDRTSDFGVVNAITEKDAAGRQRTTALILSEDQTYAREVINPEGHRSRQVVHPAFGQPVMSFDPNGVWSAQEVDGFGRVKNRRQAGGTFTVFIYGPTPSEEGMRISDQTDGGGRGYVDVDYLGRPSGSGRYGVGAKLWVTKTTYEVEGLNVVSKTRPVVEGTPGTPPKSSATFDTLGRVTRVQRAGNTVALTKTYLGLKTTVTDENGATSYTTTDPLGRVVRSVAIKEDLSEVATTYTYGYTSTGRVDTVVAPSSGTGATTTTVEYDRAGRRIRLTDPNAGTSVFHYNGFGDVVSQRNGNNDQQTIVRDGIGRATSVTDKDGLSKTVWDDAPSGVGRIARLETYPNDPNLAASTESRSYDEVSGQVLSTSHGIGLASYIVTRTLDFRGRLDRLQYPSAEGAPLVVKYDYDADTGLAKSVHDPAHPTTVYWKVTDRDGEGRPKATVLGNGVSEQRTYDVLGRTSTIVSGGEDDIESLEYAYDAAGNTTSRIDNLLGVTEGFEYDSLNRLKIWRYQGASGAWRIRYPYDDAGNLKGRVVEAGSGSNLTFNYGESGHGGGPHAISSSDFGNYSYDAAGRQTAAPGRPVIEHAVNGLPVKVTSAAGTDFRVSYDALGQRVRRSDSTGGSTDYVDRLYEHRVANGTGQDISHIWADGVMVAEVTTTTTASSIVYMHHDATGSLTALSNQAAAAAAKWRYDPFGRKYNYPSSPLQDLLGSWLVRPGFLGADEDSEVGLVDLGARSYDAKVGRFISPDPLVSNPFDGQAYNRYTYAGNNPLTFVDPSGLSLEALPPPPPPPPPDTTETSITTTLFDVPVQGTYSRKGPSVDPVNVTVEFGDQNGDRTSTVSEPATGSCPVLLSATPNGAGAAAETDVNGASVGAPPFPPVVWPGVGGRIGGALTLLASRLLASAGAIIVGSISTDSPTKPEDQIFVYRTMRVGPTGGPMPGPSARTLGARPGVDIPVSSQGKVRPNTGGMSVALGTPNNLYFLRLPENMGGKGKDPVWELNVLKLSPLLRMVPDSVEHGTIQPAFEMSDAAYQLALCNTAPLWRLWTLPE